MSNKHKDWEMGKPSLIPSSHLTSQRMNLQEYQQAAARTAAHLGFATASNGVTVDLESIHMVMGMETEVGELMDVFKKNLAYGKSIDTINVGEEVADLMWYIVNFCRINNIDLEKELSKNIAKLKVRFPDKFTAEAAINRNTDAERIELEK